ncbi:alpha-amylase family protein [Persicitalea sp.]|uniref:alpha-amylase family protein n=1 Tax=Persicitalea sp. TaxID=3100273 RepID=UPI003593B7E3
MQSPVPEHDKLIIYQIFTRLFGNQNLTNKYYGSRDTNGVGKFNDITTVALKALKDFGISHVWYTGVIEHAMMTDYSEYGIEADNPLIVKGRAGSPYAIKDYYDVDPDLAVDVNNRIAEFEALVQRTHDADLKLVIDFVPNHVARQYASDSKPVGLRDFGEGDRMDLAFDPQNNFYYLPGEPFCSPEAIESPVSAEETYVENPARATGNDVFTPHPSIYDWYETIKLNYGVNYLDGRSRQFDPLPATWLQMRDILLYWTQKGVDGFRCDMAEMVPVEFWGWVIPEIQNANPHIIFIAEIYNPAEYHNYIKTGKFDYLYDKVGLYNYLRPIMEGSGTVEDITRLWQNESGDIASHMLRFLENHDEQRIASRFFAGDPWVGVPAMTLSATLHTGPVMIYFGQEVGVNPTEPEGFQGDDGRTTIFDYWGVPEFQKWVNGGKFDGGGLDENQKKLRQFYHDLNHFAVENEAIRTGKFYDLQYVNINGQSPGYDKTRTYSYLRYTKTQRFLCIYNFDKANTINTSVKIPEVVILDTLGLANGQSFQLNEVFPRREYEKQLNANEISSQGIPITLPPSSVIIIEIMAQ